LTRRTRQRHHRVTRAHKHSLLWRVFACAALFVLTLLLIATLSSPTIHCREEKCPRPEVSYEDGVPPAPGKGLCSPLGCSRHDEHCLERALDPLIPSSGTESAKLTPCVSRRGGDFPFRDPLAFLLASAPRPRWFPNTPILAPSNLRHVKTVVLRL
jgi:hypothetical protein